MERDADQLAAQKQKVADQLTAEQTEAAEDASRTPLLKRVFGKGDKNAEPEPLPVPDTATAAAAPEPAAAPKAQPAPAPAAAATADAAPAAVDDTTTATAVQEPAPARKLNSDFEWPEDEVATAAASSCRPASTFRRPRRTDPGFLPRSSRGNRLGVTRRR